MRRPVKVSEAVSASFFACAVPKERGCAEESTVSQSDIRGSTGVAALSAVRTELPRTLFADQVEPAARIAARILRGCHRTAPLSGGRYVCCVLRCDV